MPGPITLSLLILGATLSAHGQTWKFLVLGDSRGTSAQDQVNTTILTELAAATVRERPAFVLIPGDLVNSGNLAAFQQWTNIMSPVYRAGIGVYPVIGNHDATDVAAFTNVFGRYIPNNGPAGEIDRTYAITYSNVLVLMLDAYISSRPMRFNQTWIDAVLATNTRPHVFAMSHVPAFKVVHADCLDDYPANRNAFWNSLSNAHSRIYFCGHDHFYDDMRLGDGDGTPNNDLHQMIVGTGGAPLTAGGVYDGSNGAWTPAAVFHESQYGYVAVEISGGSVKATWRHRTAANVYAAAETFSYTVDAPIPPPLPPAIRSITLAGGN